MAAPLGLSHLAVRLSPSRSRWHGPARFAQRASVCGLPSGVAASASIVLLLAFLVLAHGAAIAADDLYQARTIVTGQMEATRRVGFAQCLEDVLVKVSGDPRLIGDPGVTAIAGDAGRFVSDFRYRDLMSGIPIHDEQGTRDRPYELTVIFHPTMIDAALRSLGREKWSATRPRLVLFLGVRDQTTSYTLAEDGERGRDMREALATTARRVGLAIVLPTKAALSAADLRFETLMAPDFPQLDATARTEGGDVALAGSLIWSDEALGWVADWRLASEGKTYAWRIRGVSFDDAFRNGLRGAAQVLSGHGQPD
jgi:hypothetical protein